jgi:basic secretory peptidase family protein
MFKNLRTIISTGILIFISASCLAQKNWNNTTSENDISRDTIVKEGDTLVFINKDSSVDHTVQQNLINTFFTVYPQEVKTYNIHSLKRVTIIIDPDYKGVAATNNGIVRINPEWMHKHPQDIDVVTHEVMHIVQAYPNNAGPGWITEGIADYVRNEFGVNNEKSGWKLPEYNNKQKYTDAYRVAARFFIYLTSNYDKKLVRKLDSAMRNKKYTPGFWEKETGKTIDELWKAYASNPSIGV